MRHWPLNIVDVDDLRSALYYGVRFQRDCLLNARGCVPAYVGSLADILLYYFGGRQHQQGDGDASHAPVRGVPAASKESASTAATSQAEQTRSSHRVPPDMQAALITRLRADDEQALKTVMEAYLTDVIAVAYTYVRSTDAAADIAQEVFVRTWNRRHTLDPNGNLLHYLRRAARNTALHVVAHNAAVTRLEQALAQERVINGTHDENVGVHTVEVEELRAHIRHVLAPLSPRVREIALLYHEAGMEPGEIAEMLGVAPQTVYNQLNKAMKALTRAFMELPDR